jgi:hypothetical protein
MRHPLPATTALRRPAENFKFSRLALQAALQSGPQLLLIGWLVYRGLDPLGGPYVDVDVVILAQVSHYGWSRRAVGLGAPAPVCGLGQRGRARGRGWHALLVGAASVPERRPEAGQSSGRPALLGVSPSGQLRLSHET